jgi:hypothetical protein
LPLFLYLTFDVLRIRPKRGVPIGRYIVINIEI